MNEKHFGSCLCGGVRFEVDGSFDGFFFCHCKYCQKDTGSAHASNLVSGVAKLTWVAGEELVQTFNLPSTRHTKSFCRECGSAMPNMVMDGKMLVVPAGSLDSEITTKPSAHIFMSSKAKWSRGLEGITTFETFPA